MGYIFTRLIRLMTSNSRNAIGNYLLLTLTQEFHGIPFKKAKILVVTFKSGYVELFVPMGFRSKISLDMQLHFSVSCVRAKGKGTLLPHSKAAFICVLLC